MEFEESSLRGIYDLVTLGVAGGTQISSRTSAVLAKLLSTTTTGDETTKTSIVALTATSKAASKLISIVEIAKRELLARGQKVYQYNALGSRMTEIPRRTHVETVVAAGNPAEEESDESEEDAFEVMGGVVATAAPGQESEEMKKRNIPTLKIYLSTVSVKELKLAFGYDGRSS